MKSWLLLPITSIIIVLLIQGCDGKGQTCDFNDPECIGGLEPPENTKEVERYSSIRIHIQLPKNWSSDDINTNGYKSQDTFDPAKNKSFLISHDQLVITDSLNNTYPMKLYLIPRYEEKTSKAKTEAQSFAVFITVNDIAINTIRLNSQHTSYFQKFGRSAGVDAVSSYRPSPNAPSDYPKIDWLGAMIKASNKAGKDDDSGEQLFQQWPRTTVEPAYGPDDPRTQVQKEPIELQYLATVGMKQFDWVDIDLPCCYGDEAVGKSKEILAEQALGESNQIYKNNGTENIIAKYTNVPYPTQRKTENYDIGWHGLDPSYRSTIKRYQITRLNFTWERTNNISNQLVIPADGLSISSWDTENQEVSPIPTQNSELRLDFKVNAP